jgi:signal peptidase I
MMFPNAGKKDLMRFLKWLQEPLLTIGFVIFASSALAQPFYVPSGSMEPTLQIGDYLVGNKYAYGYSRYSLPYGFGPASETRLFGKLPSRGDVVIFRLPRDPRITYVKRVIGLPGDRVQMADGRLYLNGHIVPLRSAGMGTVEDGDGKSHPVGKFIEVLPGGRQHVLLKMQWNGPLDDTATYKVPANHIFVMGDNRDNSLDSRVSPEEGGVGFVPIENIMARADFTVASFDFLNAHSITSWLRDVRYSRFFRSI